LRTFSIRMAVRFEDNPNGFDIVRVEKGGLQDHPLLRVPPPEQGCRSGCAFLNDSFGPTATREIAKGRTWTVESDQ
jgi:hypothetical protein